MRGRGESLRSGAALTLVTDGDQIVTMDTTNLQRTYIYSKGIGGEQQHAAKMRPKWSLLLEETEERRQL